jgi:hypothetical protein
MPPMAPALLGSKHDLLPLLLDVKLYPLRRLCFFPSLLEHQLTIRHHSSGQDSPSSSTSTPSPTDQQALCATRTAIYINDSTSSPIQHHHASAQDAISSHIATIEAHLDNFDTQMAQAEK